MISCCEHCKFVTQRKIFYTVHVVSEHPEMKQNIIKQCDWPECAFASDHSGRMATHTKSHQTLLCKQCVFTTNKSIIFNKHMNQQHKKTQICGKA